MSDYQQICVVCVAPFLLVYSIWELKRGILILKDRQYRTNITYKIRLFMLEKLYSKEAADNYLNKILKGPKNIYRSAIYSIAGGLIGLVVILWWIINFN
jgi:hypothetical protein